MSDTAKVIDFASRGVKSNEYHETNTLLGLENLIKQTYANTQRIILQHENANAGLVHKEYEHNIDMDSIIIENKKLSKELEVMKVKLNYSIPIPSIIYIIVSSITLGVFGVIFFLQLAGTLRICDIRYAFGGTFVSIGLLTTAIISLNDWKVFLDEQKHQE